MNQFGSIFINKFFSRIIKSVRYFFFPGKWLLNFSEKFYYFLLTEIWISGVLTEISKFRPKPISVEGGSESDSHKTYFSRVGAIFLLEDIFSRNQDQIRGGGRSG